jgi:hypothetical protein
MSKGARIRRKHAEEEAGEKIVRRPPATEVQPPTIAKARRQAGRKAFREFRQLPREQRRPWETTDEKTTEENHG